MNKTAQDQLLGTALGTASKLGLSAIPGIGGVLSQVASPLIDTFIASKINESASSRAYNNLGTATTQTNNPYMQNGGKIPVTKLWAKYGSKENLKKKLQEGGYLEEGQEMDDDMISRMEQDLANQGSMNMDMNMPTQEVEQEEVNEQEEGNVLAEYSDEQLQSMLQELQGREDEESMQIMQMIAQELQSRQQQTTQQQPTQEAQPMQQPMLKYGGAIVGMPDLARYVGKSHAQGGILVDAKGNPTTNETNAVAEVEGGEVKYDIDGEPYIFSKRLKI